MFLSKVVYGEALKVFASASHRRGMPLSERILDSTSLLISERQIQGRWWGWPPSLPREKRVSRILSQELLFLLTPQHKIWGVESCSVVISIQSLAIYFHDQCWAQLDLIISCRRMNRNGRPYKASRKRLGCLSTENTSRGRKMVFFFSFLQWKSS